MSLRHAIRTQTLTRWGAPGPGVALAAILLWSGCLIDQDNRCDTNQVLVKTSGIGNSESCGCVANAVPDPRGYGCTLCGANETVANGKCACVQGYGRTSETGPCEKVAAGAPCTSNADCSEPFPYCATDGAERYCSVQNCSATSCLTGYACEQTNGTSYCAKLPEGLGNSCTSNADCESGEAKTCDTMQTHSCTLQGCATKQVTCPGFWACCDLGAFVPGVSTCTAPTSLNADGSCTFGTKVTP